MNPAPSPTRARLRLALAVVVGLLCPAGAVVVFLLVPLDSEPPPLPRPAVAQATHGMVAPPAPAVGRPTRFVAPSGDDGASCEEGSPCGSLDRALHTAKPGEVIQLAAGLYRNQLLTSSPRRAPGARPVVVRPAPGARARLRGLRCGKYAGDRGADAVDIGGITVGDVNVQRCDRITLRDVEIDGGIFINGSSNFSMIGGSVGPGVDYHPDVQAVYQADPPVVPRNVLFESVRFHDWTLKTPGQHIECLQVSDAVGFTLRNSRFTNCDTFDVHIDGTNAGPVRNVLVEGNFFGASKDHTHGKTPAYYGFSMRDGEHVVIRNNRAAQAFALPAAEEPIVDWTLAGNRAPLGDWQCDERIRYQRNRWNGARCSPSDAPISAR